jgi:Fe-S cluster biogenesis protein NfuA
MFIQTESTPNPATMKFIPGCEVMPKGAVADFPTAEDAARSPLAHALFATGEVTRVFFGADFISVTKNAGEWKHLKPAVLSAIMEHFASGAALIAHPAEEPAEAERGQDSEIVAQIKELIETRVRPAVAQDGGDIVYKGFDEMSGVVYLHMRGACSGCPSATMTLKQGIESLLRHYVPEVNAVEAV